MNPNEFIWSSLENMKQVWGSNQLSSNISADVNWTTKSPKTVFVSSNANNINVRHMQTEDCRAEGGRREDEVDVQTVAIAIAYEECQVCTVGWHSGSKQSVASHLDTCNNSIVWTSIKEDWWQATEKENQRLLQLKLPRSDSMCVCAGKGAGKTNKIKYSDSKWISG